MEKPRKVRPFHIQVVSRCIILLGDLQDWVGDVLELRCALRKLSKGLWIIDASDARVIAGGETRWIEAAHLYLAESHLVYLPSDLSLAVNGDQRYTHKFSTFLPDEAPEV